MNKRNKQNSKRWRATAYWVALLLLMVTGCDNLTSSEGGSDLQFDNVPGQNQGIGMNHMSPTFSQQGNQPDLIEGHYIVVLSKEPAVKNARAADALEALSKEVGQKPDARIKRTYKNVLTGFAAELTHVQVEELRRDPRVLSIEQDSYIYLNSDGTAQEYPTWGLDRIDQREPLLDRVYAYHGTGTGVTAYIMDSGIYFDHSEFVGRATLGYDFIFEDDSGLFVIDPSQEPGEDCMGHGTHVAGTVGGTTYGVAKEVDLVSVRVFDCNGRTTRSIYVAAVDWLTLDAEENERHPAVVNMSFGFNSESDPEHASATELAILKSIESGIHYVAAGGNSNTDACDFTPARLSGVLTAGASEIGDKRAWFSNYGDCIDLFAPGVSITSAFITDDWSGDGSYTRSVSGTSMASPHIAGVVALYLEANPTTSPANVHAAILANSTPNAVTDVPYGTNDLLHSLWQPVEFTPPPPSLMDIGLTATGFKHRGNQVIDLTWSPVDAWIKIYRNGSLIGYSDPGSRSFRDNTGVSGNHGTYVHQLCESVQFYLPGCSEKVTTIFGDGGSDGDDGGTDPPPGDGPTASFTYSCSNTATCEFTDTSTGENIESHTWDPAGIADDGKHTFDAGNHKVTLTITDSNGNSDTTSETISCKSHPRHGVRCS